MLYEVITTFDFADGVFIAGQYAYVADFDAGLLIIDIIDPANPILIGTCDTPGNARAVYTEGNYAYVADGYRGLQVISIADPAALQAALEELSGLTGEFEKPGYFRYDAAICAHGRSGLRGR